VIPIDWEAVWTFMGAWLVIWLGLSLLWQALFLVWSQWQKRRG
jgi:hypothetical protein